ncbi:MAG: NUDIX domain-containing protein [Rhodothermales bacterium]|nr:NUDIX domain-containing protein [Rhodothermales bacterium]
MRHTRAPGHDVRFEVRMHVPFGHKQPAVLCILTAGKHYLLLRRHREPNRDYYTPVGGKMEAFESPASAAIRETAEETGFHVENVEFCGILVDNSPGLNNWICFVYRSEIEMADPVQTGEGVLEWIDADDLNSKPIPVSDQFIYDFVNRGVRFVLNAYYDESNVVYRIDDELSGNTIYEKI